MNADAPETPTSPTPEVAPPPALPPPPPLPPTPWTWRAGIALAILVIGGAAYVLQPIVGTRGQALAGVFCFFGLVAVFSTNLRAVNWRTIAWGFLLQLVLAVLVLKVGAVYQVFEAVGGFVKKFISFSDEGGRFV